MKLSLPTVLFLVVTFTFFASPALADGIVDLRGGGTLGSAQITSGTTFSNVGGFGFDLTVSSLSGRNLTLNNPGGMGVAGGPGGNSLGPGEQIMFGFTPSIFVTYVTFTTAKNDSLTIDGTGGVFFSGQFPAANPPDKTVDINEITSYLNVLNGQVPTSTAASSGLRIQEFGFRTVAAVPEPTTLLLLGMGLVGLVAARRRSS